MVLTDFKKFGFRGLFACIDYCNIQIGKNDTAINSENNQMRLEKNIQNIPAPEPDSIPDSSSPDSSSPEAGCTPDESSPEAGSILDKLGKIKLKSIVNQQYIKAKIKKLL